MDKWSARRLTTAPAMLDHSDRVTDSTACTATQSRSSAYIVYGGRSTDARRSEFDSGQVQQSDVRLTVMQQHGGQVGDVG